VAHGTRGRVAAPTTEQSQRHKHTVARHSRLGYWLDAGMPSMGSKDTRNSQHSQSRSKSQARMSRRDQTAGSDCAEALGCAHGQWATHMPPQQPRIARRTAHAQHTHSPHTLTSRLALQTEEKTPRGRRYKCVQFDQRGYLRKQALEKEVRMKHRGRVG
jgi:hypothetical protein